MEKEFLSQYDKVTSKKVRMTKERISTLLEKEEIDFSDFIIPMTKESAKIIQKMIQSSILHGYILARENVVENFDEDFKNIYDEKLFDKYNPQLDNEVQRVARAYSFELSKFYDEANATAVKAIVADGLSKGLAPSEIAKGLNQYVDRVYGRNHAMTIVRTETTRSYALGSLAYYQQSDTVEYLEYSSVLDSRTTEICKSRDGNVYLKTDPRVPYLIPAHFNCRSIWIPVEREPSETPDPPTQSEQAGFNPNNNGLIDLLLPLLIEGITIALATNEEEEGN